MSDFISPFLSMQPRERRDVALGLLLQAIEDARRQSRGPAEASAYLANMGKCMNDIFTRYDQYTSAVFARQPESVAAEHAQIGKAVEECKT